MRPKKFPSTKVAWNSNSATDTSESTAAKSNETEWSNEKKKSLQRREIVNLI